MSPRGRDKPPALTPEESRYLDGQLPPDDKRHFEHLLSADPQRATALDRDREAMALWRDDIERGQVSGGLVSSGQVSSGQVSSGRVSRTDDLADRVLAGIASGRAEPASQAPVGGRWYAAAAAALIVVGIAGTAITRADRRERLAATAGSMDLKSMDVGGMNAHVLEAFVSDRVVWSTEGGR